jgi:hypothetical protein
MRWAVGLSILAWIIIATLISHVRMPIPSRPDTGNHGQGHSTDAEHCPPDTRPMIVYAEDGTGFFLECMR